MQDKTRQALKEYEAFKRECEARGYTDTGDAWLVFDLMASTLASECVENIEAPAPGKFHKIELDEEQPKQAGPRDGNVGELIDAEREALGIFDNGTYSCACRGEVCGSIPCRNDRNDLLTTVERILTARLAAVEAEMEVCPSGIHGWRQRTPRGTCPWCDAEAAEAERDRLAVAVERVEALADDWAELTFDDPEPDWSDDLIAALSDAGRGE